MLSATARFAALALVVLADFGARVELAVFVVFLAAAVFVVFARVLVLRRLVVAAAPEEDAPAVARLRVGLFSPSCCGCSSVARWTAMTS